MVLVVLYHAGLAGFAGGYVGVDVFFVISGFLITSALVREYEDTGSIRLLRFYAKRARRLLPASFAVLTCISSIVFIVPRWAPGIAAPQLYGQSISWDIQRSALYIVNWLFAERSIDYHGGSELASPVQHFWSLSVEEQFYAAWPILVLAAAALARSSKRAVALMAIVVTAASFIVGVRMVSTAPDQAYFVTTTRVWELSLGGVAALAATTVSTRLDAGPPWIAKRILYGGFASIVASVLLFDSSTQFPGFAALAPTIGTVAVLLAAPHATGSVLVRLSEAAPMQWIGARSYSIYLWHWPVLWLAVAVLGPLPVWARVGVVAASVVPSMASYRWIEQPTRRADFLVSRPIRGLALTGATAAVGFGFGAVLLGTTTGSGGAAPTSTAIETIETEVLGVQLRADELTPSFVHLRRDLPDVYDRGCVANRTDGPRPLCSFGDLTSETVVLVIGNSHAAHWTPALERLADQERWHLLTNIRSTCRLPAGLAGPDRCEEWASNTLRELEDVVRTHDVDLVLTMPTAFREEADDPTSGYTGVFRQLAALPSKAAIISPTPRGKVIGVDCAAPAIIDLSSCATPVAEAFVGADVLIDAAHAAELPVIDMTRFLCNETHCPAVIDDMIVRRDRHHLTRTFSSALVTPLATELHGLFPELNRTS